MDEKAVSGLVGEMLLLSLVIVLIAVLASNVFGLLPSFEETRYASFNGIREENITIIHEGGDPIPLFGLRIVIMGENGTKDCEIIESKLLCANEEFGEFSGGDMWRLGDSLLIYGERLSKRVQILIVNEKQVLCKMSFG